MVTSGETPPSGDLNRFAARYRMARKFEAVTFNGFSPGVCAGYSSALRVGLAYSALESLEACVGGAAKDIRIRSEALASRLRDRRHGPLRELLVREPTSPVDLKRSRMLRQDLANLFADDSETDVRPVVERIRHLVFHGVFSAHGGGLARSKAIRETVDGLSEEVFAATDAYFTAFVDRCTPSS